MSTGSKFVIFIFTLLGFLLAGSILYAAGAHEIFLVMVGLAILINGLSYVWHHPHGDGDKSTG